MKTNKLILLPIIAIFFLATILCANALTISTPASAEAIRGKYNFTVTTAYLNIYNCTWGNPTDGQFASSGNITLSPTNFWNYTDTIALLLTDTPSVVINITCYNASDQDSGTVTIEIDNTAPTAVISIPTEYVEIMHQFEADCSASTDAIDTSLTYSQQLYNSAGTAIGSARTSAVSDWDDGDLEEFGEHNVTCTVTDNAGNTATASELFDVTSKDGGFIFSPVATRARISGSKMIFGGLIIFLVLIVIVAILITKINKK